LGLKIPTPSGSPFKKGHNTSFFYVLFFHIKSHEKKHFTCLHGSRNVPLVNVDSNIDGINENLDVELLEK
jgi:hypothetical protein